MRTRQNATSEGSTISLRRASSASAAAVFARMWFSRRCATSASACTRSSGGICPASTRTLFSRASSCASSSERCWTATLAVDALSVQYACFTAATVCTADSLKRSSELDWFRLAMMYCWRAASILRSLSSGCEKATWTPDCSVGSKLVIGLLVEVRDVSHETLHDAPPQGSRCLTPVDVNQSLTSTPRSPSKAFEGG